VNGLKGVNIVADNMEFEVLVSKHLIKRWQSVLKWLK